MEILRRNRGVNLFYELELGENGSAGYVLEMLQNNHFEYLPQVRIQWKDLRCSLMYVADGLQSFAARFGRSGMGWREIRAVLLDLKNCILELQEYLLPPEGLALSTAYILYDEVSTHYRFLYAPGETGNFAHAMKTLFEEIMPGFSHEIREDVVTFYELYGKFLDDGFTPAMLIRIIDEWFPDKGLIKDRVPEEPLYQYPENTFQAEPQVNYAGPESRGEEWKLRDEWVEEESRSEGGIGKQDKKQKKIWLIAGGLGLCVCGVILYILKGPETLKASAIFGGIFVLVVICDGIWGKKGTNGTAGTTGGEAGVPPPEGDPKEERFDPPTSVMSSALIVTPVTRLVPVVGSEMSPIYISEGTCRIGRSREDNEYCLPSPGISRNHAMLECVQGVVSVTDMHSTNGTFVNWVRIAGEQAKVLHCGDVVSFAGEEYFCV